ncbi:hypothetical protein COU61_00860 [Candidatus Pacearchaeota archaeon CG10_big_fil_rev_8_21_14_0_10_35_13]|nr:MAG: hypothetical protein COU61_00860 [Candidatus Pacearchaeota archaeon CG10_big_fil_rev_8_21_14_0_10_35_13]
MLGKKVSLCSVFFLLVLALSLVSASDLTITKSVVNDIVISEVNQPAVFNITITNHGSDDSFSIYSLVGVDITPTNSFSIPSGASKNLLIKAFPGVNLKRDTGPLVFVYKIKGVSAGITEDTLSINVVKLSDAFDVGAYTIDPESGVATIYVKNKYNLDYDKIHASFSSAFFSFSEDFSLASHASKEFRVSLEKEDIASLTAGKYLMSSKIIVNGITASYDSDISFSEKKLINSDIESFGLAIHKTVITDINEGNLPAVSNILVKKNIISRLFTTFSVEPSDVKREGSSVNYYWQRELRPSESFTVKVTTNWLYPLIIILVAVVLGFFFSLYRRTHLLITKRVNFIRTKGGEFALRVSLHITAKANVDRIKVYDRIPAVAKLYDRYESSISPEKFDPMTRRLTWNLGALDSGEQRVLSYIIYSKVGVVGKFELPRATVVYENDGKIIESQSNRAFILAEPKGNDEL